MILLAGIPTETPMQMVAEQLRALDEHTVTFDQREWQAAEIECVTAGRELRWRLRIGADWYDGSDVRGVYTRLMDDQQLPGIAELDADDLLRTRVRALHQLLTQFIDLHDGCVINRTAAMATNASKPLQARLLEAHGFAIPPTLITNDPDLARDFHARHQHVIFKSISGQRSIVTELDAQWLERLETVRACPVQFQTLVRGTDVRVHVIGETALATAVASTATDYRYATRQGASAAVLQPAQLDDAVAERCVGVAASMGLELAGIDLRLGADGRVYCFEINPSPAFSYYEQHTGQPIARQVALRLAGRTD